MYRRFKNWRKNIIIKVLFLLLIRIKIFISEVKILCEKVREYLIEESNV